MEQRWLELKGTGYQQVLIIQDGASFNSPPTAAFCKQVRDKTASGLTGPKLTFTVLYDPTQKMNTLYKYGVNEANLVLDDGAKITFKGHYSSQTTVLQEIQKTLAP